ncbi:MAG: PspC domain-containing protein [Bacillota bacterium]|jgi:phage shock protein C
MKKLYRSQNDRIISGVCGGLAEYLNISSSLVRLLAIALTLCTAFFGALIFYIIAAIIIPQTPDYYDV